MTRATAADSATTQVVVFRVGESEYALPVAGVAEVLRMVAISRVPEAAPWLPGVINLRGEVIPVVDLRRRLGLEPRAWDLSTPIIVTRCDGHTVGLVADAVTELLTLPVDAIQPPDARAGAGGPVESVARAGDRLVLIADLGRLCEGSETARGAS